MRINNKFVLSNNNYIEKVSPKTQIVLGHFTSDWESNMVKWSQRLNGKYTKTAHYTIDKAGRIFKHFDVDYYSNILGNPEMDKRSIVILLENEGGLSKRSDEDVFINWIGHIYSKSDEIVNKKWRTYSHWAPYTKKQFESTLELVSTLCESQAIPKIAVNDVLYIENLDHFTGVLYKSNIEKHFTDLSPAWDAETFKNKLENNENNQ